MDRRRTIAGLARELDEGRLTSVTLTRECLARIKDSETDGSLTFTRVYAARALAEAEVADRLRGHGRGASALAGIPISVKDLFDVAGDVTTAGSTALAKSSAAANDAAVVQRLRAAGAIVIGRSNMTEFAYSALGLNPHYGTPRNPFDASRIPGGSSSGAATAVAHDFCLASIGTDTGGSIRVPAAFCGLVGFKPTQARIPRDGAFPLSESLDSVGPIARTVRCCALVDQIMAGAAQRQIPELPMEGLRLAVAERVWTDNLDPIVARAYERTLRKIEAAGARLIECQFAALSKVEQIERSGILIGPEGYAVHRRLLSQHGDQYDPRVRLRLQPFENARAADYIDAVRCRGEAIECFDGEAFGFDAVLAPTVKVVPPRFDELEEDDGYRRMNAIVRRNAALVNLLDGCAVSLPCHAPDELPMGLMIVGRRNADSHVLAVGLAVERLLSAAD